MEYWRAKFFVYVVSMTNEQNAQNDTTKPAKPELTIHEKKLARLAKLKEEDGKRQEQIKKLENGIKELSKKTIEARKYAAGEWMIKQLENKNENVIRALRGYIDDSRKYFFPEVFTEKEIEDAKSRTAKRRAENKIKRESSKLRNTPQ